MRNYAFLTWCLQFLQYWRRICPDRKVYQFVTLRRRNQIQLKYISINHKVVRPLQHEVLLTSRRIMFFWDASEIQNVVGLTMGKAYLQIHASSAVVIVVEYSLLQVNKLIGFFFCEEREPIKRSQFNLGSNYNNAKVYFCKMIKLAEHFRHSICQSSMFVRISSEDSITLRQDLGL